METRGSIQPSERVICAISWKQSRAHPPNLNLSTVLLVRESVSESCGSRNDARGRPRSLLVTDPRGLKTRSGSGAQFLSPKLDTFEPKFMSGCPCPRPSPGPDPIPCPGPGPIPIPGPCPSPRPLLWPPVLAPAPAPASLRPQPLDPMRESQGLRSRSPVRQEDASLAVSPRCRRSRPSSSTRSRLALLGN